MQYLSTKLVTFILLNSQICNTDTPNLMRSFFALTAAVQLAREIHLKKADCETPCPPAFSNGAAAAAAQCPSQCEDDSESVATMDLSREVIQILRAKEVYGFVCSNFGGIQSLRLKEIYGFVPSSFGMMLTALGKMEVENLKH